MTRRTDLAADIDIQPILPSSTPALVLVSGTRRKSDELWIRESPVTAPRSQHSRIYASSHATQHDSDALRRTQNSVGRYFGRSGNPIAK